jgi:acetate kinase
MGFTPTGGCMMSSRCGDIDPGILVYLLQQKQFTPQQLNDLVNHQSGLLGVSETSADMQELLQQEATDVRAAEAVELFCYEVKKWLGAFTGVLGGVDAVVFTGGIGENAPVIRARICEGLDYLGIQLSEKQNQQNEWLISSKESRVNVYVIPTDEEYRIAGITAELLQKNA